MCGIGAPFGQPGYVAVGHVRDLVREDGRELGLVVHREQQARVHVDVAAQRGERGHGVRIVDLEVEVDWAPLGGAGSADALTDALHVCADRRILDEAQLLTELSADLLGERRFVFRR